MALPDVAFHASGLIDTDGTFGWLAILRGIRRQGVCGPLKTVVKVLVCDVEDAGLIHFRAGPLPEGLAGAKGYDSTLRAPCLGSLLLLGCSSVMFPASDTTLRKHARQYANTVHTSSVRPNVRHAAKRLVRTCSVHML